MKPLRITVFFSPPESLSDNETIGLLEIAAEARRRDPIAKFICLDKDGMRLPSARERA